MRSNSSDRDHKHRGGRRQDKVPGGPEDGTAEGPSGQRTEVTQGDSAHEVHEGKLIKKPATDSGR